MHTVALGEKMKLLNPVLRDHSFVSVIVHFRVEITNWFEDEKFLGTLIKEYPP